MKWGYWFVLLIVSSLITELHGRSVVQQKWNIDKVRQAQQATDALKQRQLDIAALTAQQTAINTTIQKEHDEEIQQITTALAHSERLRISSHFCNDVTRQTISQSTTDSDETDTTSRILSAQVDRAVKQLILETEQATATGRAAQAFIRENGLADTDN